MKNRSSRAINPIQISSGATIEVRTFQTPRVPTTKVYGTGDYRIQREVSYNYTEEYRYATRAERSAARREGDRVAMYDAIDRVWVQL